MNERNKSWEKIEDALAVILESKELLPKFMQLDDIDELYEFCISVKGGYTDIEFCEYLESFADSVEASLHSGEGMQELSDDAVDSVAGGVGGIKKWIAGSMAAISAFTSLNLNTHAAGVDSDISTTSTQADSEEEALNAEEEDRDEKEGQPDDKSDVSEEQDNSEDDDDYDDEDEIKSNKKSLKEKVKKKFSKIGKLCWKHKGKILLGTLLAALAVTGAGAAGYGIYYKVKENKSDKARGISDRDRKQIESEKKDYQETLSLLEKEKDTEREAIKAIRKQWKDSKVKPSSLQTQETDADKWYTDAMSNLIAKHDSRISTAKSKVKSLEAEYKDTSLLAYPQNKLKENGSLIAGALSLGISSISAATWLGKHAAKGIGFASKKAKEFTSLIDFFKRIGGMFSSAKNVAESLNRKSVDSNFDPKKGYNEFLEKVSSIKRQPGVEDLKSFIRSVQSKRVYESKLGKSTPNIAVLNGPAGVGKTASADCVAPALTNDTAFRVSAPAIIDPGAKGKLSDQVFQIGDFSVFDWGGSKPKSIGTYLKENPNGVVIFDEYDKVLVNNPSFASKMDEMWRSVMDTGKVITANGDELDVSHATFLLLTNETTQSLVPGSTPTEDDMDPTRTTVKHDPSFLSRLRVIQFKSLSEEALTEIAEDNLKSYIRFFRSKLGGKCRFDLSKDLYEKMAEYAKPKHMGARPLLRLTEDFSGMIASLRSKTVEGEQNQPGMKFKVDFNPKTGKFIIKIVSKHTFLTSEQEASIEDPSVTYSSMANDMLELICEAFRQYPNFANIKFQIDEGTCDKIGKYIADNDKTSSDIDSLMGDLAQEIARNSMNTDGTLLGIKFDEQTGKINVEVLEQGSPIS